MFESLSITARRSATVVSAVAAVSILAQLVVSSALDGSLGGALIGLSRYFTVLTNLLVCATFAAVALGGRMHRPQWLGGVTVWILEVGVVYHLMLADLWSPQGLAWWADQGLHTLVPALAALWWLAFAPKSALGPRHAVLWLNWPIIYVIYALLRGEVTGIYPYPFLDVTAIGYSGVAISIVMLSVAFFVGGLALVGVGRLITR